MNNNCKECDRALNGRADKKFCDDQCRSSFNNRNKKMPVAIVKRVDRVLKKNREVLEKLNPTGKVVVNKSILLKAGFNFQYYTHTYMTRKGRRYIFCYDQGYLGLESDQILLVRDLPERY